MDDNYDVDYNVQNLNMDDLGKIGEGMEAGSAILGALSALITGIVAVAVLFSKKDK